jgi:hypothetical protein
MIMTMITMIIVWFLKKRQEGPRKDKGKQEYIQKDGYNQHNVMITQTLADTHRHTHTQTSHKAIKKIMKEKDIFPESYHFNALDA